MSYSVKQPCNQCKKETSCADGVVIRKAVELIHNLPAGHLGGGCIEHTCSYGFEQK